MKHYLANCGKCLILKAKPVRQLMGDLPECRLTLSNKPLKFCGMDYLGPCLYREWRSNRKAWCLLMACLCTCCIHVEMVTSPDLDSLLLAFSRFVNLRGPKAPFIQTMVPPFELLEIVYLICWIVRSFTTP